MPEGPLIGALPYTAHGSFGSWPRDNATEGVSGGRDRSDARRNAAVSSIFFRFRSGGNRGASLRHPERLCGRAAAYAGASQAPIAAISGLTPTMFITRVRL